MRPISSAMVHISAFVSLAVFEQTENQPFVIVIYSEFVYKDSVHYEVDDCYQRQWDIIRPA